MGDTRKGKPGPKKRLEDVKRHQSWKAKALRSWPPVWVGKPEKKKVNKCRSI